MIVRSTSPDVAIPDVSITEYVTGDVGYVDEDGYFFIVVAPHKRIRHLELIEQIPKSASGKILRRMLIDRDTPR
jgi:acyl-coenzyme A synthetase/AMP-(fatty) acid ligase